MMSLSMSTGNYKDALEFLDELKKTEYQEDLKRYIYQHRNKTKDGKVTDITVLHLAATFENDDPKIIKSLLEIEGGLLYLQRQGIHKGQTALHIAVARGKYKIVEELLERDSELRHPDSKFSKQLPIYERLADGRRFKNTILMGQSPLSVAALKGEKRMVKLFIDYKVDICQKNSLDETIFHSIIRYAAVHPEKEIEMVEMCEYLNRKLQNIFIWFEKNKDNLTALQLAASLGTTRLFEFIVNVRDIYCFQAEQDGLFDIKLYDITEIDSVTWKKAVVLEEERRRENIINPSTVENVKEREDEIVGCGCLVCLCPEKESILEMVCNHGVENQNTTYAQQLLEIVPVKNIIRLKWEKYSWFHYLWMVIHILLLSFLTAHSVIRAQFYEKKRQSSYVPNVHENLKYYVDAWQILGFLFSCLYLLIVITVFVVKTKKRLKSVFMKYSNNFWYLILLLIFSVSFIIDSFIHWLGNEEGTNSGFLIAALIFGWWFLLFFLRAIYHFSFFTELIGRVIFGDLLRFSVVIGFELISFTAGMCIMFTGRTVEGTTSNGTSSAIPDDNFAGYFNTMLSMFKLMLGLGEIDILYEAKSPGIAITLFISFVLLTYILMINALIAMMSVTCSVVLEGRYRHWRMQQLSAMLFLEEMSYMLCLNNRLPCLGVPKTMKIRSNVKGQEESRTQFLLEIHALQIDLASPEDKDVLTRTMKIPEIFQNIRRTRKKQKGNTVTNWTQTEVKGINGVARKDGETIKSVDTLNQSYDAEKERTGEGPSIDIQNQ